MDKKPLHTFVVLAYKESPYLEECVKSVCKQHYNSNAIIATTTDNKYIRSIAKKYGIPVIVGNHKNIGGDFDFAVSCGKTDLVTVAHQDDIYEPNYSNEVVSKYLKTPAASIIFTDYYEIRNKKKVHANKNLRIKRTLLLPVRIKNTAKSRMLKRSVIRFGDAICCPAVTFVKKNCPKKIFESKFQCNVDWHAWERLSRLKGAFVFVNKRLMGHRISNESTTTDIIKKGIRTKEDLEIYSRFWPKLIAKMITKLYRNSEKSNDL